MKGIVGITQHTFGRNVVVWGDVAGFMKDLKGEIAKNGKKKHLKILSVKPELVKRKTERIEKVFETIAPREVRASTLTLAMVSKPEAADTAVLSSLLAESRPHKTSFIVRVKNMSALSAQVQAALFGNCALIVIGALSRADREWLLKNDYLDQKIVKKITSLKKGEYAKLNRLVSPERLSRF